MATSPDQVRTALTVVTAAAISEARAVAADAPKDATGFRAAMFAATPLVVSEYASGAASLAADWFEEIRDAVPLTLSAFAPKPLVTVTDADVSAMVAQTTEALYQIEQGVMLDLEQSVAESMAKLEAGLQKQVATGFWDTMTSNSDADPDARGWQRFTRPGACKFCLMLHDRGGVYTRETVDFAAHTNCHCVAGPCYDPTVPQVDVIQYVASAKRLDDPAAQTARNAKVRAYLNHNFPDAPG